MRRQQGVETVCTLHVVSLYCCMPTVVPDSTLVLHSNNSSEGVAAWQHAEQLHEVLSLLDSNELASTTLAPHGSPSGDTCRGD